MAALSCYLPPNKCANSGTLVLAGIPWRARQPGLVPQDAVRQTYRPNSIRNPRTLEICTIFLLRPSRVHYVLLAGHSPLVGDSQKHLFRRLVPLPQKQQGAEQPRTARQARLHHPNFWKANFKLVEWTTLETCLMILANRKDRIRPRR
jgi:hypothetical protein